MKYYQLIIIIRTDNKSRADLRTHVVHEAEGEVLLDALHAVAVLPPGGAEVLLQGTCHGRKYGQRSLTYVHDVGGGCALVLLLHPTHMSEGLLHSHYQPDKAAYSQLSRFQFFNPYCLISNACTQCDMEYIVKLALPIICSSNGLHSSIFHRALFGQDVTLAPT